MVKEKGQGNRGQELQSLGSNRSSLGTGTEKVSDGKGEMVCSM